VSGHFLFNSKNINDMCVRMLVEEGFAPLRFGLEGLLCTGTNSTLVGGLLFTNRSVPGVLQYPDMTDLFVGRTKARGRQILLPAALSFKFAEGRHTTEGDGRRRVETLASND